MMTPRQIRDCRLLVQQRITGNDRAAHKTDPIIKKCMPEALDEIDRLRQGIVDIALTLGLMEATDLDAKSFEGDVLSLAMNQAKVMIAECQEAAR